MINVRIGKPGQKHQRIKSCKGCRSAKLTKNGKNELEVQRHECKECGRVFIEGDAQLNTACRNANKHLISIVV